MKKALLFFVMFFPFYVVAESDKENGSYSILKRAEGLKCKTTHEAGAIWSKGDIELKTIKNTEEFSFININLKSGEAEGINLEGISKVNVETNKSDLVFFKKANNGNYIYATIFANDHEYDPLGILKKEEKKFPIVISDHLYNPLFTSSSQRYGYCKVTK